LQKVHLNSSISLQSFEAGNLIVLNAIILAFLHSIRDLVVSNTITSHTARGKQHTLTNGTGVSGNAYTGMGDN
jgi:hypothetical protein